MFMLSVLMSRWFHRPTCNPTKVQPLELALDLEVVYIESPHPT